MKNRGKISYTDYTRQINQGDTTKKEDSTFDCSKLTFLTILELIQEPFYKSKVGDFLKLKKNPRNIVTAYNSKNEPCGNITSPFSDSLIHCMNQGYKYKAEIITLKGKLNVEVAE